MGEVRKYVTSEELEYKKFTEEDHQWFKLKYGSHDSTSLYVAFRSHLFIISGQSKAGFQSCTDY